MTTYMHIGMLNEIRNLQALAGVKPCLRSLQPTMLAAFIMGSSINIQKKNKCEADWQDYTKQMT